MEYELWYSKSENSYELVPLGGGNVQVRAADAVVMARFDARSWDDAVELKNQFVESDQAT